MGAIEINCCVDMKSAKENSIITYEILEEGDEVFIISPEGYDDCQYTKINYCPFCGKKIE